MKLGLAVEYAGRGVEVPIERMAVVQKQLIARALRAGKPVITATQMLESMTASRLPTRAESTDVANAILDGTDCIMLSGESAMGKFPEESVAMLARIADASEPHRPPSRIIRQLVPEYQQPSPDSAAGAIAELIEHSLDMVPSTAVFVPTHTGTTARMISRHKPPAWIIAVSEDAAVCRGLAFSYGVHAVHVEEFPESWGAFVRNWLAEHDISGRTAMLVTGPHSKDSNADHQIRFIRIGTGS